MKKPIINNWIKYCTGTLAVAGLFVMGSCDNNKNNAADNIETTTEETVNTTRENVSQEIGETETETEQLTNTEQENPENKQNQPQYERSSTTPSDRSASSIRNMDAHLEEYKEENKAIKKELTDANLNEQYSNAEQNQDQDQAIQSVTPDISQGTTEMSTPDYEQEIQQDRQEASREKASNDVTGEGEIEITREIDPETPSSIYERHLGLYSEDLSGYAKQRLDDVMNDYNERRESMRGQADEQTGVYIAPEVDPVPTIGFEALKYQIFKNIEYPWNAQAANVEGVVLVNLVVDENGKVTEVKAMDELIIPSEENTDAPQYPLSFSDEDITEAKEDLKREAERAVQATAGLWEAGTQDGEKVKSAVLIPINFEVRSIGVGEDEILGEEGQPVDIMD